MASRQSGGSDATASRDGGNGAAAALRDDGAASEESKKEPPYEFWYEVSYFFRNGVPLGISSILTWGFPPFFALISESLRSSKVQVGWVRRVQQRGVRLRRRSCGL